MNYVLKVAGLFKDTAKTFNLLIRLLAKIASIFKFPANPLKTQFVEDFCFEPGSPAPLMCVRVKGGERIDSVQVFE